VFYVKSFEGDFFMRLLEIRNSKGMTQKQLAERLGVTIRTITNYENGSREPNIKTLIALTQIFGVSADYLLGLTDDPSPH
jgi:transcriptional regulator with XRE-family HTH domain